VRGEKGLGCSEEQECISQCDFIVGTFGKALASVGAYVVCSNVFKQFLVNHSRTLIFTTALPPLNLAWTNFVFERLPDFVNRRNHLKVTSMQFSELINVEAESHIIPFIAGSNEKAIQLSEQLKAKGYYVLPIRYPTVPKGTARLRFSLNSNNTIEELKQIPQTISASGE
jgi:8-amino-7-oxononanoate synthase